MGEITVRNLSPGEISADGSTTVVALFAAAEIREVAPDGTLVEVVEAAASDIQYLLDLGWTGNRSVSAARVMVSTVWTSPRCRRR